MDRDEIRSRLAEVRRWQNLSQQEMARRLGITGPAWQHYESGENVPGGLVLVGLGKLGVNLNWLLLGEEEMERKIPERPPEAARERAMKYEAGVALVERLGLADLANLASFSRVDDEFSLVSLLNHLHPLSLGLDEIVDILARRGTLFEAKYVRHLLSLLKKRDLVVEELGVPLKYRTIGASARIAARDETDRARIVLKCVEVLCRNIFPRMGSEMGGVGRMRVSVRRDGVRVFVRRLLQVLGEECQKVYAPDGEFEMEAIIGASIAEEKKS